MFTLKQIKSVWDLVPAVESWAEFEAALLAAKPQEPLVSSAQHREGCRVEPSGRFCTCGAKPEAKTCEAPLKDCGARGAYVDAPERLPSPRDLRHWEPTPDAVNALPERIRSYIHELVAQGDPAGMVAENVLLHDQVAALSLLLSLKNSPAPVQAEEKPAAPVVGQPGVPAGYKLAPKWKVCVDHYWCKVGGCSVDAAFEVTDEEFSRREKDDRSSGEWAACPRHAKEAGAIVPVEPSRPGTGETVDWSRFVPTEEIPHGSYWGTAEEGDYFASTFGASTVVGSVREVIGDGTGARYVAGERPWDSTRCRLIRHADGRWADGYGPDGPIVPPAPGKPDEAPLSNVGDLHWKEKVDALEAKLAAHEETEREYDQRIAQMEAQLATRTAEVESLREKIKELESQIDGCTSCQNEIAYK